jgi:hypothetical protein
MRNLFLLAAAAVLGIAMAGCTDPEAEMAKPGREFAKGGHLRVTNLSDGTVSAQINGQQFGRPIESGNTSAYRLVATNKPVQVDLNLSDKTAQEEVPVASEEVVSVYVLDGGQHVVVRDDLNNPKGEEIQARFLVLGGDAGGAVLSVGGQELSDKEVVTLSEGTHEFVVKRGGTVIAKESREVKKKETFTAVFVPKGSGGKLHLFHNNPEMIITGPSGSSRA